MGRTGWGVPFIASFHTDPVQTALLGSNFHYNMTLFFSTAGLCDAGPKSFSGHLNRTRSLAVPERPRDALCY